MSLVTLTKTDHIQGDKNAAIELVEYGDYQCPYCGQAYFIVKDIQKKLGKNLKFVFRNYPLEQLHPYAFHAAIAAETAGLQGKFWEMHDMLLENQRHLDDPSLIRYAKELGLDLKKFEQEFGDETTVQKIENDVNSGNRAGVEGTPTFFVNGKLYEGNWTGSEFLEDLKSLI